MNDSATRKQPPREVEMSIESAILIATKAHRTQHDLGGNPYILHPLRVMLRLAPPAIFDPAPYRRVDFMLAAVLHDVVEDSDWTLETLHDAKCPPSVLEAVDHLTRRKAEHESYSHYIARVVDNQVARLVKLMDLQDNLEVTRLRPSQIHDHAGLLERDYRAYLKVIGIITPEQLAAIQGEERARVKQLRRLAR